MSAARAGRGAAARVLGLGGWTVLGLAAAVAVLHDGGVGRRRPPARRAAPPRPRTTGRRTVPEPPPVPALKKRSRPQPPAPRPGPALRRPDPPPPLPTFRLVRVAAPLPASIAQAGPEPAVCVEAPPARRHSLLVLSAILTIGRWTALGAGAALCAVVFLPYLAGGRALTVMSGSMTPAVRPGDVVVNQRIAPASARVGDVITFVSPGSSKLITHRVRKMTVSGRGTVSFVTKGDAGNGVQRWSIPTTGSIGLVRLKIPKLGYAMWWARTPTGRLVCLIVPAVLLGLGELRRIWRPQAPEPRIVETSGAA